MITIFGEKMAFFLHTVAFASSHLFPFTSHTNVMINFFQNLDVF
jgi:hypothetical protein